MVRLIHKNIIISGTLVAGLAAVAPAASVMAGNTGSATLQANVAEVLTLALTEPTTWASTSNYTAGTGDTLVSDFIRNKIGVSVISNNLNGYTASMYTKTNETDLINSAYKNESTIPEYGRIPTLTANTTVANFGANQWGYSLDDNGSSTTATYSGLKTSANPIQVLQKNDGNNNTRDVYFGAKADTTKDSGTYAQTVVFSVVSGITTTPSDNPNNNPVVPENPATPNSNDDIAVYTPSGNTPYYSNSSTGATTYTTTTTNNTNNTTTKTTTVTTGDTRTSYANAQGVTTSSGKGSDNTALAIGFATAAVVAAGTGIGLYAASKRRKDDEE